MLVSILTFSSVVDAGVVSYTNREGKQVSYDSRVDVEVFSLRPNMLHRWKWHSWTPANNTTVSADIATASHGLPCTYCFLEVEIKDINTTYWYLINISGWDTLSNLVLTDFDCCLVSVDVFSSRELLPTPRNSNLVASVTE